MALQTGARAKGADFQNLTVKKHAPLDSGTTTSGTFTTTRTGATSPVGITFTAPPSGKVMVHWACGIYNSVSIAGNSFGVCAFQVKTGTTIGSGTTYQAAADTLALQAVDRSATSSESKGGRAELVDGLTAGDDYNLSLMYRIGGAGTGNFSSVSCTIVPCIA